MRGISVILMVIGVAMGLLYPWALDNFTGDELAKFPVFSQNGKFLPATLRLQPDQSPLLVRLNVEAHNPLTGTLRYGRINITITEPGGGERKDAFTFYSDHTSGRNDAAYEELLTDRLNQTTIFRAGDYRFDLREAKNNQLRYKSANLLIIGNYWQYDPLISIGGRVAIGVGIFGLFLTSRRKKKPKIAKPKWGRQ